MAARHVVESKVKWSTAGAYLASSGVLGVLGAVEDSHIVDGMPDSVSALVLSLVPALVTFVAGWKAKHTPRPGAG
jgi:hypothetical protein